MARSHLALAALFGAIAIPQGGAAQEGPLTEVWALEGFSTPESALYDPERGEIYVSNVAGEATARDGRGFISRVSPEGEMLEAEWVTGLDAPKGLARDRATLYVTDIDRLVAIDVATGEISGEWPADGAQFLNDAATDGEGRVFASDMDGNRIYLLEDDALSVWLDDEGLNHPNGLKVEGDRLVVAAWGEVAEAGSDAQQGGHLLTVDLETKTIAPLGDGEPVGNLDGLEPAGDGEWLVTDWIAGALYRFDADGAAEILEDLPQGSADLGFIADRSLALVPMMMEDRVVAYRVE